MGRRRSTAEGPHGLLLVDKPAGISSAAVVARVRRVFGGVKAGHTGTLDPFATGLLPVCLGEGTKLATYLTDADKSYEGIIRLGVATDTHDRTGAVISSSPVPPIDAGALEAVAARFRGEIRQVPPRFSAIKKEGRPMYERARAGETPELEARTLQVHRLDLSIAGEDRLAVSIDCSKGFYVRSLAHEIGQLLGCGAMLEELRRTSVGPLRIGDAVTLATLESGADDPASLVIAMDASLGHMRRVAITAEEASDLRLGRQSALARVGPGEPGERVRLSSGTGGSDLVAVAVCQARLWTLERVFAAPVAKPQGQGPAGVSDALPCPPSTFVLPAAVSQMEEEERNEANRRD